MGKKRSIAVLRPYNISDPGNGAKGLSCSGVQRLAWGNFTSNTTDSLWNHLSQKVKNSKKLSSQERIRPQASESMQKAKPKVVHIEARLPARTQAPHPAAESVFHHHVHGAGHSLTGHVEWYALALCRMCACACVRMCKLLFTHYTCSN